MESIRRNAWIVTALEGQALPAGDIASRLGGFSDVEALEAAAGRRSGRAGGTRGRYRRRRRRRQTN